MMIVIIIIKIVIILIMMIIIIALKGAIFTISSLRHKLSPTRTLKWPGCNRVQITCNTSSTCHVQPVVCHLVQRDSSAIKFDRVEIAFLFELIFYLLKPLSDPSEHMGQ